MLDLIAKRPETTRALAPAIPALAPGFPNPAHAVARTLDRLCRSHLSRGEAFALLAEAFASMGPDGAPALAEDTSFDLRTVDALLSHREWGLVPTEVRRRHATTLADKLGSPRVEVRARAADLLRHYPDQMPTVWPALVALLTGRDEAAALAVLRYFHRLAPVMEDVTPELTTLFRERDPALAARAVVALWRLGRTPTLDDERRAAVTSPAENAWGEAVVRDAVERAFGPDAIEDLSRVFAAAPAEVAANVQAILSPPELPEEAAISAHVRPEGEPRVDWTGVYQRVCNDPEAGLLFLALMCAHGSGGFAAQKIWMIKHHRGLTGSGLAESKSIVERVIDRLRPGASGDRRACARDFFIHCTEVPAGVLDLLDHRLSWYRWAGLELLDAWGAPELLPALVEDRLWDRSPLVRVRALRTWTG